MTIIKTDLFDEPTSDTLLDEHTSDSGGSWAEDTIQTDTISVIAATDVVTKTSGTGNQIFIGDEGVTEADTWAECEGIIGGVNSADRMGVIVRCDGGATPAYAGSSFYALRCRGNDGWYAFRVNAGTFNNPTATAADYQDLSWLANNSINATTHSIRLKLQVTGTGTGVLISVWVDFNVGSGWGGYVLKMNEVVDDETQGAGAIDTAGDVGIHLGNSNVEITSFNAEDLTVVITDVDTDDIVGAAQTPWTITGTGFGG